MTQCGKKILLTVAFLLVFPLAVSYAGINEDLAAVDTVIQLSPTPIRITGQDAYNIYQGATAAQLEQKRQLLSGIGITNFASVGKYSNFYSFTGTQGYTDTKINVTTVTTPVRLYRRGSSAYPETKSYLGRWWGTTYRGIEATRNEQAVLAAWGSDLNRIYVINVPVGTTLIGGVASPMEKNGEYRAGGAYQYFYQGAQNSWLVYALYAPDYVSSYASAITGAQKLSRTLASDVGLYMNQLRSVAPQYGERDNSKEGEFWVRAYGANSDYSDADGKSLNSQMRGMSLGWDKMLTAKQQSHKERSYIGFVLGQGNNDQKNTASHVENKVTATFAGVYGMYINRPESSRAWYGNYSLLYGGLNFKNTVPGELGYGLAQDYTGKMIVLTVENGVTLRQPNGLIIEPQLQLSYVRMTHDSFTDQLGGTVVLRKGNSCWGRVGIEVRKTMNYSVERQLRYWARVSYMYDLLNKNTVEVSGDSATSQSGRNGYLFALGIDMKLSRTVGLQGEVVRSVGSDKGYQGNIALNYHW